MSQQGPRPRDPPKVTGLSPKEGPPGTKMTIRGENLGNSFSDIVSIEIVGVECIMYIDWKSSSKILCRSGRCKGTGEVIVTTRSGGKGTCTVQFTGYEEVISPTKESAVWIDEDNYFTMVGMRNRSISPSSSIFAIDPLNLCVDEETPTNRNKWSQTALRDLFPSISPDGQGYGNILSPNFIPAWYLLENHSEASFNNLKKGLVSLRNRVNGQTEDSSNTGPITFLKPNVLAVIECLDALRNVHYALKKDRQEVGAELTSKIEDAIKKASEESHSIFDSILDRKESTDSTRNALNVLQRYRFLFNLPSNIERNIQKGDYDITINDYGHAKALFGDSQVDVFKKVYTEVEQRIYKFRNTISERLKSSCSDHENRNIDEVKKLIRYLISLEMPGNPAWESVLKIKETLISTMNSCRDKHLNLVKNPKPTINEPKSQGNDERQNAIYAHEAPQAVQFIEEISTIFNESFPDLVRLGQVYLNGELHTRESDEQLKSKEETFNVEMIQKPILYLVNLLRSALLPTTIKNIPHIEPWPSEVNESFVIWLPHCLRCVINCYHSLSKQEINPSTTSSVLQNVQQLVFDLRVYTMVCLFNQAAEEVKMLYLKENWDVQLDDSVGTRTQLPLLFESKVVEILQLVRETVIQSSGPDKVNIFSQINVQGQMKQLAQNLIQAFIKALENTVTNPSNSPTTLPKSVPNLEDRILIVICNFSFTSNYVLPRLHDSFEKFNYPDMNMVVKITQAKYRDFENKLFEQYVERKCESVIGLIEPSMYLMGKEWYAKQSKPTDVSFYVKETIMSIIEVQSDVFSIGPPLVRKVMVHVIDSSIEEITRIYESVADRLSTNGNVQAIIDVCALQYVFDNSEFYRSVPAKKMLAMCRSRLKTIKDPLSNEFIEKIANQFKQTMELQLCCFKWETDQTVISV